MVSIVYKRKRDLAYQRILHSHEQLLLRLIQADHSMEFGLLVYASGEGESAKDFSQALMAPSVFST